MQCHSETPEFLSFLASVQSMSDAYMSKNFPTLTRPTYTIDDGNRYIRVVCNDSGRRVYCFVDKKSGDVLKAAGWKAPAKGARGNIFDESNGCSRITPYGMQYNNSRGIF